MSEHTITLSQLIRNQGDRYREDLVYLARQLSNRCDDDVVLMAQVLDILSCAVENERQDKVRRCSSASPATKGCGRAIKVWVTNHHRGVLEDVKCGGFSKSGHQWMCRQCEGIKFWDDKNKEVM